MNSLVWSIREALKPGAKRTRHRSIFLLLHLILTCWHFVIRLSHLAVQLIKLELSTMKLLHMFARTLPQQIRILYFNPHKWHELLPHSNPPCLFSALIYHIQSQWYQLRYQSRGSHPQLEEQDARSLQDTRPACIDWPCCMTMLKIEEPIACVAHR